MFISGSRVRGSRHSLKNADKRLCVGFVNGVRTKGNATDEIDALAELRRLVDVGPGEPIGANAKVTYAVDDVGDFDARQLGVDASESANQMELTIDHHARVHTAGNAELLRVGRPRLKRPVGTNSGGEDLGSRRRRP